VNAVNNQDITPLHLCVEGGYLAAAQVLMDAGANIMARDVSGRTPRDMARKMGQKELEKILQKSRTTGSLQ
jgi:ankyrin repeat protein